MCMVVVRMQECVLYPAPRMVSFIGTTLVRLLLVWWSSEVSSDSQHQVINTHVKTSMAMNASHSTRDDNRYHVRGQKLRKAVCLTPWHSVKSHLSQIPASVSCHLQNTHVIPATQSLTPSLLLGLNAVNIKSRRRKKKDKRKKKLWPLPMGLKFQAYIFL